MATTNVPAARDIMSKDVCTLERDTGLVEAAEKLVQRGVSNAPVVSTQDGRPRLAGFISEKDLMQCYASGEFYRDPKLTAADIMRVHPVGVRPEADLFTLAAVFMQHDYRHLPVVDRGFLLGIVSRHDVLRALLAHYHAWQRLDRATRQPPDLEHLFAHRFIVG